jgi:hypothetical protein
VAQGVGPEFKPQSHQKKKKKVYKIKTPFECSKRALENITSLNLIGSWDFLLAQSTFNILLTSMVQTGKKWCPIIKKCCCTQYTTQERLLSFKTFPIMVKTINSFGTYVDKLSTNPNVQLFQCIL